MQRAQGHGRRSTRPESVAVRTQKPESRVAGILFLCEGATRCDGLAALMPAAVLYKSAMASLERLHCAALQPRTSSARSSSLLIEIMRFTLLAVFTLVAVVSAQNIGDLPPCILACIKTAGVAAKCDPMYV